MKTVGKFLEDARVEKNFSKKLLEERTRIKHDFIDAIEKERWDKLPGFAVVAGFVKSIAHTLEIEERQAIALLRRDYPPEKRVIVSPKRDIEKKFYWGPKYTFFVGVVVVFMIVAGYLGLQYKKFVSPPVLVVETPIEDQVVDDRFLTVSGLTDPETSVKVNNQPAIVDDQGKFTTDIEIGETTTEVAIVAVSRAGRETVKKIKINN